MLTKVLASVASSAFSERLYARMSARFTLRFNALCTLTSQTNQVAHLDGLQWPRLWTYPIALRKIIAVSRVKPAARHVRQIQVYYLCDRTWRLLGLTPQGSVTPGNVAPTGHLTNQLHDVVAATRTSVTCATYTFSPKSSMRDAIKTASKVPDVVVCVSVVRVFPGSGSSRRTRSASRERGTGR